MRLVPLHNVLSSSLRLLGADAAAMRLVPRGVAWQPLDVAVGDTALLRALNWVEGDAIPEPPVSPRHRSLFGLVDVLRLYLCVEQGCVVFHVDVSDQLLAAMPGQFKNFEKRGAARELMGSIWFALAFSNPRGRLEQFDYEVDADSLNELLIGVATQALWALYQSRQAQLDPVTALPGSEAFRARLQRGAGGEQSALFLLSVDGYSLQRKRFGQEHAERLLGQAARCLERVVRKEDGLFCYREAQFGVVAQVQDDHGGQLLADKLLNALQSLAEEHVGVSASVGYVRRAEVEHLDAQAMCLAAEQALDHARLRGGQQSVAYTSELPEGELSQRHLASSLLTDPERGYRNNHILWRALELFAAETDPAALAAQFSALLTEHLEAVSVLLVEEKAGELQLLGGDRENLSAVLSAQAQQQITRALRERELSRVDEPARGVRLAIPLLARHQVQGCLYVALNTSMDAGDQLFLSALADQVAGALDRARLVRHSLALHEQESQALRARLNELNPNPGVGATLEQFPSSAMQSVMEFVGRVAPTDVSVLIMGESGAGKEVMARTIHAASDRAAAPLVIVDCSAITPSLIESELFGRVKGAFTGADAASEGRIAQADGGTLFLDEIGELPLDVQAKLLRFAQEKEVSAVGATQARYIDTRIICATNRDLQAEVHRGTFRADLYYRLQAIQVTVPPLRQRVEDLPQLVDHFVAKFNQSFNAEVEGLSEAAWLKVRTYPWPGNVRELQNAIMRAVLMTQSGLLGAHDLELNEQAALPMPSRDARITTPPLPLADTADPWQTLQDILLSQVDAMFIEQRLAPLGRWLSEAVVLAAWELNNRVVVSAARTLGLAETTLRRQLGRAQENQDNPLSLRSAHWQANASLLEQTLLRIMTDAAAPAALAEVLDHLILKIIDSVVGADHVAGAALLGVTPPTYTRRIDKLKVEGNLGPVDASSGAAP